MRKFNRFWLVAALALGGLVLLRPGCGGSSVEGTPDLAVVPPDLAASSPDLAGPPPDLTTTPDAAVPAPIRCGGFAGWMCPFGLTCFDDPSDQCSDRCGADCGGICVVPTSQSCGGLAGRPCTDGLSCLDDPSDNCDPVCGGADCGGLCVTIPRFTSSCQQNTDCPDAKDYCARGLGACQREGHCRPRPDACTKEYSPVCGCSNTTYGNACEAARAGDSLAHQGACVAPICGGNTVGSCVGGLTCSCCPLAGPTQNCVCSTACVKDADCHDPARPLCTTPAPGETGFCIAKVFTCCWLCE